MADRADGPPPLPLYATEVGRGLAELGLFLGSFPLLPLLPAGDGHPVLVLPGLLADDVSTRPLRAVLRRLGYWVHGWRLGRNLGPTRECIVGMGARLHELRDRHQRLVSVIGWSLGGIFARELARAAPSSVRQVITLGSPIRMASTDQSRAHRAFQRFSHLHVTGADLPPARAAAPLPVPATSIYSRLDGIVAWQACLDVPGPRSENIAVFASHMGIGHHPAAIYAVVDRLAQPEGTWSPFHPPRALRLAFPRPDEPLDVVAAS